MPVRPTVFEFLGNNSESHSLSVTSHWHGSALRRRVSTSRKKDSECLSQKHHFFQTWIMKQENLVVFLSPVQDYWTSLGGPGPGPLRQSLGTQGHEILKSVTITFTPGWHSGTHDWAMPSRSHSSFAKPRATLHSASETWPSPAVLTVSRTSFSCSCWKGRPLFMEAASNDERLHPYKLNADKNNCSKRNC